MTKLLELLNSEKPDFNLLPGGWEAPEELVPNMDNSLIEFTKARDLRTVSKEDGKALIIEKALNVFEIHKLIGLMNFSPNFEQVSVQGRKDIPSYEVGSNRTSIWSLKLAQELWPKIKLHLPSVRWFNNYSETDWISKQDRNNITTFWKPVGLTPLFRFMKYNEGGKHFAHYDSSFIYKDPKFRTLQSIVIYLTTHKDSGATRFIEDRQTNKQLFDRNYSDWIREVEPREVKLGVYPEEGNILVFDHQMCHDVQEYKGKEPRVIVRADILYEAA